MTTIVKANEAHAVRDEIRFIGRQVKQTFFALIERLKYVRDNDLALALGYDSFADFVRDEEPSIGFKHNTVRAYIHLYELYTEIDRVAELEYLGWGRAQVIAPHVSKDPDEWIAKAETLSSKDLINDVRVASGKQEMPVLPPPASPSPVSSSYQEYCKTSGCAVCHAQKVDMHHYPFSRVGTDDNRKVVPLCRACHREFHDTPWSEWKYHKQVINFLFNYILREGE